MAFKLPTPSFIKNKPTASAAPPTTTTPAAIAKSKAAAAKPPAKSGGLFGSLFTSKKNTNSLTGKNTPVARQATTALGPQTNSDFGGNSSGANSKTQKIAATVAANKMVKQKGAAQNYALPILGKYALKTQFQVLGTLAGLFFILMLAAIGLFVKDTANISTWTNITSQLQFHTQRLAKSAGLAARGDVSAFPQLQDSRDQFQIYVNVLNDGGEAFNVKVPSAKLSSELTSRMEELTKRYETASGHGTSILAAKNDLTNLGRNVAQVRAGSEELAGLSQQLTVALQQSGVNPVQVLKVNRLTFLAERLGRGSAEILGAEIIDPEVTFLMGRDTNDFRDLVKALESGSESIGVSAVSGENRARVAKLRESFTSFEGNVKPILDNVQKLISARQSGRALQQGSEQLLANVEQMQGAFADLKQNLPLILAFVFGILMFTTIGLMGYLYLVSERKRGVESELENKRNQEAILRLLNEMGDLADGDLTIRAKVTEDITGAIADSMNYTIDELRSLVTGVNNASTQVSAKSQQAQAVSVQLLDAAEKQSREIQSTTEQVLTVANTLSSVSTNAEESSKVAMRSLAAADKGRLAVQNSITGMNDIREQIQETSKRIKRLGESSQEIGEIVELISDITEQTNVLALNAAIQAASAGEAGRGFSVVAEEVQRLAERSAEATKQIGAIVKTIQADTQDAVAAMEKSTTGVVEGAKLSDAAGQALTEIDSVTKNLADLIQKISSDTQTQATSASKVARNMQDILEINRQTTAGTQQTASSIKELADVASDLKASVSGFKL
jgi:twitching motility protein PilJ